MRLATSVEDLAKGQNVRPSIIAGARALGPIDVESPGAKKPGNSITKMPRLGRPGLPPIRQRTVLRGDRRHPHVDAVVDNDPKDRL